MHLWNPLEWVHFEVQRKPVFLVLFGARPPVRHVRRMLLGDADHDPYAHDGLLKEPHACFWGPCSSA